MTSERARVLRPAALVVPALVAFGCPQRSEELRPTAPGQIVVDVSGAGDLLVVRCGATSNRVVAEDLPGEVERCRKLASVPVTQGRVLVKADTPFSAVFAAAQLLDGAMGEPGSATLIEQEGKPSVPFRPWDVCPATTPTQACTRLALTVLRGRVALKTWPGHVGPCASARRRAPAYADRPDGKVASTTKPTLVCDVQSTGSTAMQLGAAKARLTKAAQDVPRCSVGSVSVHHEVSWSRVAAVVAEVQSWTGEVPALSAIPTEEAGLLGCEDDG